jgi:TolB-like protein
VLTIVEESYDFGLIPFSDEVRHAFKLKNTGESPLSIGRIQTSCACLIARLEGTVIRPGGEAELSVEFDPHGLRHRQRRTIWIHSNDPNNPHWPVDISAVILEARSVGAGLENVVPDPLDAGRKPPAPGVKLNLAVAEFESIGVPAGSASVAADWVRNALVMAGGTSVVDRRNMQAILAEHSFEQTGCTQEDCAVKLGRLLNVQRMVVGNMGKFLDQYIVIVQLVDVETGKVIFGDSAKGRDVDQIEAAIKDLARRLAQEIR